MINIKDWNKEDFDNDDKLKETLINKFYKKDPISILDLVPAYQSILKNKTYGLWMPPGSPEIARRFPASNLSNLLLNEPAPQIIIMPLNLFNSISDFKYSLGLIDGVNYNEFLKLIKQGIIRPVLCESPEHYTPNFYQEIFEMCKKCNLGDYLPQLKFLNARYIC